MPALCLVVCGGVLLPMQYTAVLHILTHLSLKSMTLLTLHSSCTADSRTRGGFTRCEATGVSPLTLNSSTPRSYSPHVWLAACGAQQHRLCAEHRTRHVAARLIAVFASITCCICRAGFVTACTIQDCVCTCGTVCKSCWGDEVLTAA
jgi:hypothetical protein